MSGELTRPGSWPGPGPVVGLFSESQKASFLSEKGGREPNHPAYRGSREALLDDPEGRPGSGRPGGRALPEVLQGQAEDSRIEQAVDLFEAMDVETEDL